MTSRTGIWVAAGILCCLLLTLTASLSTAAPFKIYEQQPFGGGAGNPQYINVHDDTAWIGWYGYGAQQWGDEQKMGMVPTNITHPMTFAPGMTAILNATDYLANYDGNVAKAAFPLGGYIYMSNAWTGPLGGGYMCRIPTWDFTGAPEILSWPAGSPASGGDSPDGACTDGTDIYTVCASGSSNSQRHIYGWTVNGTALTQKWIAVMPARCRMVSYYAPADKLYAANQANGEIYEIDPATGAYTTIAQAADTGATLYQCVRYGNKIYAISNGTEALHTFTFDHGTWSETSVVPLGMGDIYGIGVKGDGTEAQYFWITSIAGKVSFWALHPFEGTPKDLGDADNWKNGYPVYTKAVVTAHAPSQGFWVENQSRTAGAFVAYQGALPGIGKFVTIKAGAGKNDAGERVLTPIAAADAVVEGETADPGVEPLIMTGKSLGSSATGIGVATDGMLVKITGKVTGHTIGTEFPGAIYLDDGSTLQSGQADPAIGVKISKLDGLELYDDSDPVENIYAVASETCFATVTGIVRIRKVGDIYVREIQVRSGADIKITVQ